MLYYNEVFYQVIIGHNKPNLTNTLLTQLNVTMDATHQLADWRQRYESNQYDVRPTAALTALLIGPLTRGLQA
jgi:hypothetical protein